MLRSLGESATSGVELSQVVWLRPLVVEAEAQEVHIGLQPRDDGSVGFEVYTGESPRQVHCQGVARALEGACAQVELEAVQGRCARVLEGEACYARYAARAMAYGPSMRGLLEVHAGAGEVLARLRLPAEVAQTASAYVLHPSVLDSALQ